VRAEYDSEARALQIVLADAEPWTDGDEIAGLQVAYAGGVAAGIEVLRPDIATVAARLAPVAERLGVDAQEVAAVAQAALAVPDREVTLAVGRPYR